MFKSRGILGRSFGWVAAMLMGVSLLASGCGLLQSQKEQGGLLIAGTNQFSYYAGLFEEAFTRQHPELSVIIQEGDTTPGILALRNGAIDIAITSRDLNENEDDKHTKSYLVAKDALHIVVHPSNPVGDLTVAQLKSIFTGKIDNWKQLGGSDLPIRLVTAERTSASYAGLNDLVMEGEDVASEAVTKGTGKEIADAVAADEQAIGFVATRDLNDSVKALTVDQVEANRYTVYSGRYPLTRAFYFVVKSEPSALTQKFIDFFLGGDGRALLESEGALPLH